MWKKKYQYGQGLWYNFSSSRIFYKTCLTTKPINDKDKSTVFDILEKTGSYSKTYKKLLNSAGMKDALNNLPKTIAKPRSPPLPLPLVENEEFEIEESDELQGEGLKNNITFNIIDI